MQPFQCDQQPQLQETHRTTHTRTSTCCKTHRRNQSRPERPQPQPPHRRGTFHRRLQPLYTEKRKVSCSSHFPSSPLPFITASLPHHFPSSPLPIVTASLPHHFPSSPLPFIITSLLHHFPSSPLPIVTTSLRHHFPSSPLPFLTTSHRHRFPSSPLPFLTTPLHHHFPSSPLPFVTTSHRHHFPSSPLPFVTTSHRHHFPSSPLPFVTTSLRHHPSLSPPFIKVNSTASYSFVMYCYVMYCYVIYHPASFQVAEFYLSVTRKYCFPTSFDNIKHITIKHTYIETVDCSACGLGNAMRAANVPGPLHIHCILIIILSQCKATTPKNGFAAGLWNPIVPICSSAFQ